MQSARCCSSDWKPVARRGFALARDNPMSRRRHACAGDSTALFTRKCAWCGAKLGNPDYVERMGKRFCSEDHANQYLEQTRAQGAGNASGGC